jgi:hypothetical protein
MGFHFRPWFEMQLTPGGGPVVRRGACGCGEHRFSLFRPG